MHRGKERSLILFVEDLTRKPCTLPEAQFFLAREITIALGMELISPRLARMSRKYWGLCGENEHTQKQLASIFETPEDHVKERLRRIRRTIRLHASKPESK